MVTRDYAHAYAGSVRGVNSLGNRPPNRVPNTHQTLHGHIRAKFKAGSEAYHVLEIVVMLKVWQLVGVNSSRKPRTTHA